MQKSHKKILNIILRICAPIPLVLAIPISILTFGTIGIGGVYQVFIEVVLGVNFMLIVASCLLVMFGRAQSRMLRRTVGAVIVFTVLCLLIMGSEALKESFGVGCDTFWYGKSCAEEAMFWISVYVIYPFIFVPLNAAAFVFLSLGLLKEYKYRHRLKSRKKIKRP